MRKLNARSTKSNAGSLKKTPQKYKRVGADETVHVLLRVRSENGQTITSHRDMAVKKGAALLGKMGQPVGPDLVGRLNNQIQLGTKTYLFLTIREGWNGPYVTYRCPLRQVHEKLDPAKRALVPGYYAFESHLVKTWFEIAGVERLDRDEMNRIVVLSSGRTIMSVIASSATVFCVGFPSKK